MKRLFLNLFIFAMCALLSGGCAKLAHLQELLTLKAYSENQELQTQYVKEQDAKFKALLKAIKNNAVNEVSDRKNFIRKFGEPVFCRETLKNGQQLEKCLYRYALEYFDSDKVYVYFDKDGQLTDWRFEKALAKEENDGRDND